MIKEIGVETKYCVWWNDLKFELSHNNEWVKWCYLKKKTKNGFEIRFERM